MSERIECLMQDYGQMVMERECLKNQIDGFKGLSSGEVIGSMYFTQPEGERVQAGGPSDKTASIAIAYRERMERLNEEWLNFLERRYMTVCEDIRFFESAVGALSGNLPDMVSDMVMGGMTWDALADKYHISRTMVAKSRRKAIRELDVLYARHDLAMREYILS